MDVQLAGKFPNNSALLVPCIVKDQMDFLFSVFSCYFAQHAAYFCCGYVAVICDNQHFLCDIIHGTKDVIAPAS